MVNYTKVPKNLIIDYIPKDYAVCKRCIYEGICPYEYTCPTAQRVAEAEGMMKE